MELLTKLIFGLAIASSVLAIALQPVWQAKREQKIADQMKAMREALRDEREEVAAADAILGQAMSENQETTERMKNLRRGRGN